MSSTTISRNSSKPLRSFQVSKTGGFQLVYSSSVPKCPVYYIVYQSDKCKIRFRWEQDRPYETPSVSITYGRSHAPPDQSFMMWDGEKCWCWHEGTPLINFLDGLSPLEASKPVTPHVMHDFQQSSIGKGFEQSEYLARKTAYIWERYGQRIFDLYDLRNTSLWNIYVEFLKESQKIIEERIGLRHITHHSDAIPPLYKVC